MNDFNRTSKPQDRSHYNQNKPDVVNEKAKRYVSNIGLLLDMDTVTTNDIKEGINSVETLVKENDAVTTSQIRNIFKLIKDTNNVRQLNMIRPKLAYISARQRGDSGRVIAKVIDELIIKITGSDSNRQNKKIINLKYIAESIVAYHKFYVKES